MHGSVCSIVNTVDEYQATMSELKAIQLTQGKQKSLPLGPILRE